jgi:hypothetical protein
LVPQLVVAAAKTQPSPSTAQVVELLLPLQNDPAPEQFEGAALQVQLAPPPDITHAECGPQATPAPQTPQPDALSTHVSTPPPAPHRVAPNVHTGVQA